MNGQKLELHKYYHVKVLLKRFHLNGHILGFHTQTQKLELRTKYIVPCKSSAEEVAPKLEVGNITRCK